MRFKWLPASWTGLGAALLAAPLLGEVPGGPAARRQGGGSRLKVTALEGGRVVALRACRSSRALR